MEYKNINKCYSNDFMELYHCDCMELLKQTPDNYYSLALVDPPYGIDINNQSQGKGGGVARKIDYTKKNWDKSAPEIIYFNELRRVSKNQIVWGANYMTEFLKPSRCWISWYKMQEFSTNEFELAWTSFDETCKQFNLSRVQAYA